MSENCTHDCSSCGVECPSRQQPQSFAAPMNAHSHIKKVIGVVSGKGGVGKSLVTGLMAVLANRKGYQAAVLDADITGPSIPRMFAPTKPLAATETELIPAESAKGVKLMSINLLLESDTDPVIWRGPVIAGTVKQFWTDVSWGDVDFMFVDMPPGTGDVPLTVFQSLPVDGIIIVTSPQELVGMIVQKAVNMANVMDVPVLGIVENMSYMTCPDCGKKLYPFGESHVDEIAQQQGIARVGQLPIDPMLAAACDGGAVEMFVGDYLNEFADGIFKSLMDSEK
ncbi:MAG: Mrp/NBP35 family ATP-binding protein [Clostridia bacterium]|nr:Mrp/NBP35 family ATP-binding protein [Clostridia bacterium]